MFRIDSQGAVNAPDATEAVGSIVGYFTEGNPQTATPATVVSADWLNTVQEELIGVVVAAGLTPDKDDRTQVLQALNAIIQNSEAINPFVLANNQIVAADVTGLVFDKTKFTSAEIIFEVYRKDGAQENMAIQKLVAVWKPVANTWILLGPNEFGDDMGVTWSITAVGQVKYQSTNYGGGSYVGTLKTKVTRFKV